jgi:hypothetical protein
MGKTAAATGKRKNNVRAELDTSEGWCCDGRTYKEHAHADGKCCQEKGTQIDHLPQEGEKTARERVAKEG